MYFRRKIDSYLRQWKDKENRLPLIIKGARQIGKTESIVHFASENYENIVFINFVLEGQYKTILSDGYSVENIIKNISLIDPSKKFIAGKTLIVFDELQEFPDIATSLKAFKLDGRFDVICSGSLLGINYKKIHSNSVGYKTDYEMFSMDFEEFLWAMGDEATYPLIRHCFEAKQPLGTALHRKIMNDFRQYILVGGMPQSVLAYMNGKDFEASDVAKRRILKLYHEDVAKFAEGYEDKVFAVFDGIPGQLSKKEKKYKLSSLGKQARFRTYEDSFVWLNEAMIVNTCFNATDPHVGLALSADNATQKCYMADTGLLVTHTFQDKKYTDNELYRAILFDKLNINEGMLMENIVAQMLRHSRSRLYFYSRSDSQNRENHMEIDFLITEGKKIAPVEVKSGNYRSHSSLDKFRKHFSSVIGNSYILYTKDVMIKDGIIHLPLYMAELL